MKKISTILFVLLSAVALESVASYSFKGVMDGICAFRDNFILGSRIAVLPSLALFVVLPLWFMKKGKDGRALIVAVTGFLVAFLWMYAPGLLNPTPYTVIQGACKDAAQPISGY